MSSTWTAPTADEFKSFFFRDFNFAEDSDSENLDLVTDRDVQRGIDEGQINFNTSLFGTNAQITNVFMYLSAFCMVRNLQNSAKGITSQAKFPIGSTNVGSVSISFQIPEKYSKDPFISAFAQNGYGMRYLELALPWLIGNVSTKEGATTWGGEEFT